MPACGRCEKPLSGKVGHLPGSPNMMHWSCIVCTTCLKPFEFKDWYVDSFHQIFHIECAESTMGVIRACDRCNKLIDNKFLPIDSVVAHPECFRCSTCDCALTPATIYGQKNQRVHCGPCYQRAYPEEMKNLASDIKWMVVPQPMSMKKPMCELIGSTIPASLPTINTDAKQQPGTKDTKSMRNAQARVLQNGTANVSPAKLVKKCWILQQKYAKHLVADWNCSALPAS
ncbi:hypothetical protein DM01DRAFT_1373600 [Hesseltinella vesiculosa]|uniref:LIM zinc-binding domain-containing protein n=1 Tax=Hesseltinella vesiculosa TaxID=101127 RepID=A0A1X2GIZ3_9FUNG|nr:hypothetical protein DM01DRAFT_1373600 [Hesseltinella vesiculosa]